MFVCKEYKIKSSVVIGFDHIRKIPNCARSSIVLFRQTDKLNDRIFLVSTGSITPSSHNLLKFRDFELVYCFGVISLNFKFFIFKKMNRRLLKGDGINRSRF